ncbi:hypothetical protein [Gelidibacter japonicus]|uniref:hypothetical protein n=1 Tax=Gelidibacter japonicus TaxID=1962232 RepID=UPI003A925A7B
MNSIHITLLIIFGFIIVMTLILNLIKKDRINLIGNFIAKVMPSIPFSKIFGKERDTSNPEDGETENEE